MLRLLALFAFLIWQNLWAAPAFTRAKFFVVCECLLDSPTPESLLPGIAGLNRQGFAVRGGTPKWTKYLPPRFGPIYADERDKTGYETLEKAVSESSSLPSQGSCEGYRDADFRFTQVMVDKPEQYLGDPSVLALVPVIFSRAGWEKNVFFTLKAKEDAFQRWQGRAFGCEVVKVVNDEIVDVYDGDGKLKVPAKPAAAPGQRRNPGAGQIH